MAGLRQRRRVTRDAGRSAAREHERLTRQWRAEHRRLFVGGALVVLIICVVTFVPAHQHPWPYLGGMLSGSVFVFYILVRESPPGWIDNYLTGSFGEQRTAKALTPLLDRGWVIVHDLARANANLDHVLIGPAGAFVLDTKNWRGTAHADGDLIAFTRPDGRRGYRGDGLAAAARAQGADLNHLLRQGGSTSPWVSAVIVIWAEFDQKVVQGRNMSYVHGAELVDWLLSRPARLNAKQIDQLAAALHTTTSATAPAATT
jgi:hypothetical protein